MALSGSFGSNFAGGYRIQIDWTATQNIPNNASTITARLYLVSLGSSYTISSSSSKTGSTSILGTTSNFTATAGLSGNQKKLLHTQTYSTDHNADGTKSASIGGTFNIDVNLGGQVSTVSTSQTVTLDAIPRTSTVSSNISWTALNNLAFSISRASSAFTHRAELRVGGTLIKTIDSLTTSGTFSFNLAENTTIIQRINANNKDTTTAEITLYSYSSGTLVGSTTKTGTVLAPSTTDISISSPYTVGNDMDISASKYLNTPDLSHVVEITLGTWTKEFTRTTLTSFTWTPTSAEITSMLGQMAGGTSKVATVTYTTFYNGVQVRNPRTFNMTFTVDEQAPTFSASQISYVDSNSTTTAITGNNQYIIQGQSTLSVSINSPATGKNGATISQYVITVNGVSVTRTSTGTHVFGVVNSSANVTLSVKAVDSRGNSTTVSKAITVIPHSAPNISAQGVRANGFDTSTTISMSGSFSALSVAGATRNYVQTLQYRYRSASGTFTSWTGASFTTNGTTWTGTSFSLTLSTTESYTFEMRISDRFTTKTVTFSISAGSPLMFLDSTNKALGINRFPEVPYRLDVDGGGRLSGNLLVGSLNVSGTSNLGTLIASSTHSNGNLSVGGYITGRIDFKDGNVFFADTTSNVYFGGTTSFARSQTPISSGVLSLSNGWTNYNNTSGTYELAGYTKLASGQVILKGLIKGGLVGSGYTITTLPSGCRPAKTQMFAVIDGGNNVARLTVSNLGVITTIPPNGTTLNNGWLSLDGVSFYAEQ